MMRRTHAGTALRAANLSMLERNSLFAGLLSILVAAGAGLVSWTAAGGVRAMGLAGLLSLGICAASRGFGLYRAGTKAVLPTSVGRTTVRLGPSRGFAVVAVAFALVLPLAVVVAVLAMFEWAWLAVAAVALLGCAGIWVTWAREAADARAYWMSSAAASGLLQRLCIVADVPVPELVVEHDVVATAWTTRGRIHVTSTLLDLLDDRELEAVLAHEVAHLARRDAAVMEICSAPSRVLLSFASFLTPRLGRWTWNLVADAERLGLMAAIGMWLFAALCVPPAVLVGWIARLSVLGLSRAREFAADAAAVTLTGRPSALASALMKLEHERRWAPHVDLRRVERDAVLCLVGTGSPRLGRLLSTHPSTTARVKRLEAIESRLHGRGTSGRPIR
jgi:heat shock protein HtpX